MNISTPYSIGQYAQPAAPSTKPVGNPPDPLILQTGNTPGVSTIALSKASASIEDTVSLSGQQPEDADTAANNPVYSFDKRKPDANGNGTAQTADSTDSLRKDLEQVDADKTPQSDTDQVQQRAVQNLKREIASANISGDAAATLRKAQAILQQAPSSGNLSPEERAIISQAERLEIRARFELQQETAEQRRIERQEVLDKANAEAAEKRRKNTPSPFREITTPFDKIIPETPIVHLGTSINVNA